LTSFSRKHSFSRKQLLIVFGVATAAFNLALLVLDQRLEATGGPSILGLEFAGSEQRAVEIMVGISRDCRYGSTLDSW
jgi:hypothetical protein